MVVSLPSNCSLLRFGSCTGIKETHGHETLAGKRKCHGRSLDSRPVGHSCVSDICDDDQFEVDHIPGNRVRHGLDDPAGAAEPVECNHFRSVRRIHGNDRGGVTVRRSLYVDDHLWRHTRQAVDNHRGDEWRSDVHYHKHVTCDRS